MNRTQGNPDYAVVKPWVQLPSNCVLPVSVLENWNTNQTYPYMLCPGVRGIINATSAPLIDPATGQRYDPAHYPELNGGAGLAADLSRSEERRVGEACVSTCRSRWSPVSSNNTTRKSRSHTYVEHKLKTHSHNFKR